jgi:uncharacterized membrane protein
MPVIIPADSYREEQIQEGKMTRLCSLGLLASALIVALVFWPSSAGAQTMEGTLVQAPDGTLYVVEGGALHAIEPVPMGADSASLAVGSPVTTGVAIIPPPPVFNVGEVNGLRVQVVQVQRQSASTPDREIVQLRLRLSNVSTESIVPGGWINAQRLQLANGSTVQYTGNLPPDELTSGIVLPGTFVEGNTAFTVPTGQPVIKVLWSVGDQIIEVPLQP